MRVPVSWLRDLVDLPAQLPAVELAARLTMLGLKLESIHAVGADVLYAALEDHAVLGGRA